MKRFRFAFIFSIFIASALLASLMIAPISNAAPGDAVIIRIFVASYWSAKDYHVEPAGFDTIIPPIEKSEQGEAFVLYSFALVEGAGYDFVYTPNNDMPPVPLHFTASAHTPEYICEVVSQTMQARAAAPAVSPAVSSTPRPSSSAGPSEELTVDTSDSNALVLANTGAPAPEGNPGDTVRITLPLAVNRDYLLNEFYSLRNITIEPDIPVRRRGEGPHIADWPFDIDKSSYLRTIDDMSNNARQDVSYDFRISPGAEAGAYSVPFRLSATVLRYNSISGAMITEDVEFTLTQYVNVLGSGGAGGSSNALELSSAPDASQSAPRGKGGERISIRLPLVSNGDLTDVSIEPVFSADADECPIVYEAVNYSKALPDLARGESTVAEFNFKLLPDETGGNKPLTFKAEYRNGGAAGECLITTFIYVEPEDTGEENASSEPPVLTIVGYTLAVGGQSAESLYAGESARLALQLRNNAAASAAYKLRVAITPDDKLLLEPGATNTQYIESIEAGNSAGVSFDLSARGNAMQGPASLDISVEYEGENGEQASFSQSISLSLLQRVRVETEPAIVNGGDAVTAGEPFPVRVKVLNLGMAEVRNIRAVVEGDLTTFESYFGRAILPSESVNVELRALSEEGERSGHVVITFESGGGETHELSEPIRVTAQAAPEATPETSFAQAEIQPATNDALMTAIIAGGSALAIVLGAVAYLFYKRLMRKKTGKAKRPVTKSNRSMYN